MRQLFLLAAIAAAPCLAAWPDAHDIVDKSVKVLERNWKQAPQYSFTERDAEHKDDTTSSIRTSKVYMIDGSPYYRLIAVNDEPLPARQDAREERKLQREIARRRKESASERASRIAEYQKGRKQDHMLMREMVNAFDFHIRGEGDLDGHRVWVLDATPRPGYEPPTLETRALTGMRGKLWIDQQTYQWVKVEAKVFKPVTFGWFIAKVRPGTSFLLEQAPVTEGLWLPRHFHMQVASSILWWQRNSSDDETYTDYQPMAQSAGLLKPPAAR
jgi:hypothetical protein